MILYKQIDNYQTTSLKGMCYFVSSRVLRNSNLPSQPKYRQISPPCLQITKRHVSPWRFGGLFWLTGYLIQHKIAGTV